MASSRRPAKGWTLVARCATAWQPRAPLQGINIGRTDPKFSCHAGWQHLPLSQPTKAAEEESVLGYVALEGFPAGCLRM